MRARFPLCVASALIVASFSESARADAPSCASGDLECGRKAFAQGTQSFDRGDYVGATAWYSAAAAADARPAVLYNWAVSEARSGKLLAARARLEALLADARADAALRVRAERERDGIDTRVARVRFELLDPEASRVELDGVEVTIARGELLVDPGPHRIRVSSAGAPVFDQTVELAPGERLAVRLGHRARAIDIVVVPAGTPARASAPRPVESTTARSRGLSPTWLYIAAGATVALGGVSLWSGLDVQSAYDDYRDDLPELTQAEADERVDSGHARERRTNLLLGATAVAALGTAALGVFFVDWKGQGVQARLEVTPGGLNAQARF